METIRKTVVVDENPGNLDPITKEPGSHPVATGLGSATGAMAGAAAGGALGGPVGAVVGGVVGAVAGGAGGHVAGEAVNPTLEDSYWKANYKTRPYYREGTLYPDYHPAYRLGWEAASKPEFQGRDFSDIETELEKGWDEAKMGSSLAWHDTKEATRDAWDRVHGD